MPSKVPEGPGILEIQKWGPYASETHLEKSDISEENWKLNNHYIATLIGNHETKL